MTATEPTTLQVELLDPRDLAPHPRNVRADLGDLTGLTESIRAQGVIEPLTVVPLNGTGFQLVAGHRRAAAAIAAGLDRVPCIVRPDLAAAAYDSPVVAEHVGAMLAENLHREGLTAVEEARGVQAMLDLGMKLSQVAKRTGLGQKRVKKAVGVSRFDEQTAAAVEAGQLDLDAAAAIAVYADEPEVATRLAQVARDGGPGRLAHALEQEKQQRKARQAFTARVEELRAAGRTVLEDDGGAATRLTRLNDAEGRWLADFEEEHQACPGSAVVVHAGWNGPVDVEVCTDYVANGHVDRWATSDGGRSKPETEEEKEAAKAERRQVIENNKAMAAANSVRRAWLKEFLARRSAPAGVLRFAIEEIAADPSTLRGWLGSESAVEKDVDVELGVQKPVRPWSVASSDRETRTTLTSGEQVTDARLSLQLLAHVAGGIESTIPKDGWRRDSSTVARWLRFLADQGYTLSDVEQDIVDRVTSPGGAS